MTDVENLGSAIVPSCHPARVMLMVDAVSPQLEVEQASHEKQQIPPTASDWQIATVSGKKVVAQPRQKMVWCAEFRQS